MKVLIKFLIALSVLIAVVYCSIYFAVPYLLNKNDFDAFISKSVKNQTGLILVLHNSSISMYPNLDIKLKTDDIQLFYPDKRQILNIRDSDIDVSFFSLLKKEIKINKITASELQFTTKLLKSGKTTFQEYLEQHKVNKKFDITISNKLPAISIKKYLFKLKDDESGQKFKLSGDNLKLSQNIDIRYLNFSINGTFYCFDKKYLNYNIKLAVPKKLFENVPKKLFDINFDNLYKYSFLADLTADVKIHENKGSFDYLSGKINVDHFYIILGNTKLPESYFHAVLNKGRAVVSSKFYTAKDEVTDISADLKLKKPYNIKIKCYCPKADIANLQRLSISLLEILKIKNNLSEFNAGGKISANFSIITNLKNISSSGSLKIMNAYLRHKDIPLNINSANALVDFSDNMIKIKQSDLNVNNQPLKINGIIDNKASADLSLNASNLDINNIIKAFTFIKPCKNFVFNSGKLSFSAKIKGVLSKPDLYADVVINSLSAFEKTKNINIQIPKIQLKLFYKKGKYNGSVTLYNLSAMCTNVLNSEHKLRSELISAVFDSNNINISPFKLDTGNARLVVNGKITDYLKTPEVNIQASGNIDTSFIKSLLPKDITVYSKGYLPLKMQVKQIKNVTSITAYVLANPKNYITPVHINNFSKINSLSCIQTTIKGNDIYIDNFSIYYAKGINGLTKDIKLSNLKKAFEVKGKIKNFLSAPSFENLHLLILENLSISLPIKGANLDLKAETKADLILNGTFKKPSITGNININSVDIEQYLFNVQNLVINFYNTKILLKLDNLKIKDSDVSVELEAPVNILYGTNNSVINRLDIHSSYLDMNSVMSLMNIFTQAKYAPGADFPYCINSGKLSIANFKMDKILVQNVTGNISAKKNYLYITDLFANAYGGKAAGKITYSFPYMSVQADLQGRDMDAKSAANAFIPQKQKISGRLNFDTSVNLFVSDIDKMIKTMSGSADILVKNGHLGQLGRFEHFLYAQNLLAQRLIYASLNSARQAISPKDTGYITYLKGKVNFANGIAHLNPITTSGPQMSMYITGNINILNNYTNLQILGKISSEVSSSLGVLGSLTIKDFLDEHTKYGASAARLFNFYNKEIPDSEIQKIPALLPDYRYDTKTFEVQISGDPDSVKSVKNFNWVSPAGTKQKLMQESAAAMNTNLQSIKGNTLQQNQPEQKRDNAPLNIQPVSQPDFLDAIPDKFSD